MDTFLDVVDLILVLELQFFELLLQLLGRELLSLRAVCVLVHFQQVL